jgi:hypothetical protein
VLFCGYVAGRNDVPEDVETGGGANVGRGVDTGRDFTGRDWRSEGDRRQQLNLNLDNLSRADLYVEIKALSALIYEARSDIRVAKVETTRTHDDMTRFVNSVNAELKSLRLMTTIALGSLLLMTLVATVLYLGYGWRINQFERRLEVIERSLPTPTPWWLFPGPTQP